MEYPCHSPTVQRWFVGKVTRFPGDGPTRVVVAHETITERKRMEIMLRASEQQYRRIVETAREGIWSMDAGGKTTFVNQRMLDLLGYMAGEMLSAPLYAFVDEKDYALAAQLLERRRHRIAEQHEFKFRRRDGTSLWAIVETTPIVDEHGKYGGALAMVTDITERKQAEEALRASEARFSTIFHASPLSIALTQLKDNTFVDLNQAWQGITGFSREEALGRTPIELNVWVNLADREVLIGKLREQGQVQGFEFQIRQKSGHISDLLLSAEQIQAAGEPCMLSMAIDITEYKRAEQERDQMFAQVKQQRAQLRALAARLAAAEEAERRRLARELHDRVGQSLTALSINLNIIGSQVPENAAAQTRIAGRFAAPGGRDGRAHTGRDGRFTPSGAGRLWADGDAPLVRRAPVQQRRTGRGRSERRRAIAAPAPAVRDGAVPDCSRGADQRHAARARHTRHGEAGGKRQSGPIDHRRRWGGL